MSKIQEIYVHSHPIYCRVSGVALWENNKRVYLEIHGGRNVRARHQQLIKKCVHCN